MMEPLIEVTEIQRFCTHDGPGIRTTVFMKCCPLRCFWCHNPETACRFTAPLFYEARCIYCGGCEMVCPNKAHHISEEGHSFDRTLCKACGRCVEVCPNKALEPISQFMTIPAIIELVKRDVAFYGENGGITLSGGEPMFQDGGRAALMLLRAAKEAGLNTVIETCGIFDPALLPELVPLVDLFLWDVKDTDSERYKKNCGGNLALTLSNLKTADALGARTRVRGILLNGINTEEAHYKRFAELVGSLKNRESASFFPYHAFSGSKMLPLGFPDNGDKALIPSEAEVQKANTCLE